MKREEKVFVISVCTFLFSLKILALRNCDNPGKSKAIVNLNSIIAFFLALYFIRGSKFEIKSFIGILFAVVGIYLII